MRIKFFIIIITIIMAHSKTNAQAPGHSNNVNSQQVSDDKKAIETILKNQTIAWNNGNLEEYMEGYWKSDDLLFIGKSGVTKGWNATLANYKKSYPDKKAMGELTFEILSKEPLGEENYLVIGKWNLKREKDNLGGHFSLTWKKINGKWVIIADHSS